MRMLQGELSNPERGGFEVYVFADARAGQIKDAINRVLHEARPDDVILIYYSGHCISHGSGFLYLTTIDTNTHSDTEVLLESSISLHFIANVARVSPSKAVILVLDCDLQELSLATFSKDRVVYDTDNNNNILVLSAFYRQAIVSFAPNGNGPGELGRTIALAIGSGVADREQNGEITFADLYDYVETTSRQTGDYSDSIRPAGNRRDRNPVISRNPDAISKEEQAKAAAPRIERERAARREAQADEVAKQRAEVEAQRRRKERRRANAEVTLKQSSKAKADFGYKW